HLHWQLALAGLLALPLLAAVTPRLAVPAGPLATLLARPAAQTARPHSSPAKLAQDEPRREPRQQTARESIEPSDSAPARRAAPPRPLAVPRPRAGARAAEHARVPLPFRAHAAAAGAAGLGRRRGRGAVLAGPRPAARAQPVAPRHAGHRPRVAVVARPRA